MLSAIVRQATIHDFLFGYVAIEQPQDRYAQVRMAQQGIDVAQALHWVGWNLPIEHRLHGEIRQALPDQFGRPVRCNPARGFKTSQRELGLQPLLVFFKGLIERRRFCSEAFGMIIGQLRRRAVPAAQLRGIGEEGGAQLGRLLEAVGGDARRRDRVPP